MVENKVGGRHVCDEKMYGGGGRGAMEGRNEGQDDCLLLGAPGFPVGDDEAIAGEDGERGEIMGRESERRSGYEDLDGVG